VKVVLGMKLFEALWTDIKKNAGICNTVAEKGLEGLWMTREEW
jgi:hypothetical protein